MTKNEYTNIKKVKNKIYKEINDFIESNGGINKCVNELVSEYGGEIFQDMYGFTNFVKGGYFGQVEQQIPSDNGFGLEGVLKRLILRGKFERYFEIMDENDALMPIDY